MRKFLSWLLDLFRKEYKDALPDWDGPWIDPDKDAGANQWHGEQRAYTLKGTSSGAVSLTTRKLREPVGRAGDGGHEFCIITLTGKGFVRLMLMCMNGGGRGIRLYCQTGPHSQFKRMNIHHRDLPSTHRWRIAWGGGQVSVWLDGRTIAHHAFDGVPTKAIAGGYMDARRSMTHENCGGEWRDFKEE